MQVPRFALHLGTLLAFASLGSAQITPPLTQPAPGVTAGSAATTTTVVAAGVVATPAITVPATTVVGPVRLLTVSVTLADSSGIYYIQAPPPPPPLNLEPGATLKISVPFAATDLASVVWYKSGQLLPGSLTSTLEIAAVTAEDSGTYSAIVTTKANVAKTLDSVTVRVETPQHQRLLNLSTRTTISASNPRLISGFVVTPGPGKLGEYKQLLVRAVGPGLAKLGVAHPLAAPKVQFFDAAGRETDFDQYMRIPESLDPHAAAKLAAPIVGAQPLDDGAKDYAIVWSFPAGPYTVHVSSADGGTGDVLLEIYELPDNALWSYDWHPVPLPPVSPTATAAPAL